MGGSVPAYSSELVWAFVEELKPDPLLAPYVAQLSKSTELRIPVDVAHSGIEAVVDITRDPDLGLKASRHLGTGNYGTLYYLVNSSATVRDAIATSARFSGLVNDLVECTLEEEGNAAIFRLENSLPVPRAALDFLIGGIYQHNVLRWFGEDPSVISVWFPYPEPETRSVHELTFSPSRLRFAAPCAGFAFGRQFLDAKLPTADARLHSVLLEHASRELKRLNQVQTTTSRVRQFLRHSNNAGEQTAITIAAAFGMTTRTLSRHLRGEGTSLSNILDDYRREVALRKVDQGEPSLEELARVLGYMHQTSFFRAFRRWTGLSPKQFKDRLTSRVHR